VCAEEPFNQDSIYIVDISCLPKYGGLISTMGWQTPEDYVNQNVFRGVFSIERALFET